MKDATGELSMTVVVIIAVIAIIGILTVFLLPQIGDYVREQWEDMSGTHCTTAADGTVTCN